MQLVKSASRSGTLATIAGALLVLLYVAPEFFGDGMRSRLASTLSRGVPVVHVEEVDLERLDAVFAALDYRLEEVRSGQPVPRLFVEKMPTDLDRIPDAEQRKETFIKLVLPLVLSINERIAEQRERLVALLDAKVIGKTLSAADEVWLGRLAAIYGTDADDPFALLDRVDAVPVSLVLAQAIEESGWGASRFAREGNALFGQRVWGEGEGIVPEGRAEGENFMVRRFNSIAESISAYIHNLNTHPAYEEFRRARAKLQDGAGEGATGHSLAATLLGYSEKGIDYVRNLQSLISGNRLQDFETAELAKDAS